MKTRGWGSDLSRCKAKDTTFSVVIEAVGKTASIILSRWISNDDKEYFRVDLDQHEAQRLAGCLLALVELTPEGTPGEGTGT